MATAAPQASTGQKNQLARGVEPLRAGQGHSFLLRKLHSLSGIVPIGAFLIEHILSNFEALKGPAAYAAQVKFLNSLPLVRVLEWGFIFIPLAYHALYGVYIALRGKSNVVYYPWAGNWMYMTQRWTGYIAFIYIIQHVIRQRFTGDDLPTHPGMAFHKVQVELSNPWMLAVYIIAMIAVCWHFSYGIWLFAAKWGITPGNKARQRFGYVCAAVGILLCALGLASLYAFVGPNFKNAPEDVAPATSRLALPAASTIRLS
jgi:succinate dehydrogenase / fumarate reductase cytochrome b subunit